MMFARITGYIVAASCIAVALGVAAVQRGDINPGIGERLMEARADVRRAHLAEQYRSQTIATLVAAGMSDAAVEFGRVSQPDGTPPNPPPMYDMGSCVFANYCYTEYPDSPESVAACVACCAAACIATIPPPDDDSDQAFDAYRQALNDCIRSCSERCAMDNPPRGWMVGHCDDLEN